MPHDGVHRTPVGWVLLGVQDPDGHEVRFYTVPLELPDETFLQAYDGENRAAPLMHCKYLRSRWSGNAHQVPVRESAREVHVSPEIT